MLPLPPTALPTHTVNLTDSHSLPPPPTLLLDNSRNFTPMYGPPFSLLPYADEFKYYVLFVDNFSKYFYFFPLIESPMSFLF